jgi:hypothetical protein
MICVSWTKTMLHPKTNTSLHPSRAMQRTEVKYQGDLSALGALYPPSLFTRTKIDRRNLLQLPNAQDHTKRTNPFRLIRSKHDERLLPRTVMLICRLRKSWSWSYSYFSPTTTPPTKETAQTTPWNTTKKFQSRRRSRSSRRNSD